jgi:hypothetical protein
MAAQRNSLTGKYINGASCLVGLLAIVGARGLAAADQSNSAATFAGPRAIHLIDDDLSHFDTWLEKQGLNKDPDKTFTVKDGILQIYGPEFGYLATKNEYENYQLIIEFKWGKATCGERAELARDSGVWVHCIGEHGAIRNRWMAGIECNILEGGTGDILLITDGTDRFAISGRGRPHEERKDVFYFDLLNGVDTEKTIEGRSNWWGKTYPWHDVKGFRGEQDIEKPLGEWNRLEYSVIGRHISIILNGVLVNQVHNVKPYKGKILIQAEQADIYFRKLDLIPLTDTGGPR